MRVIFLCTANSCRSQMAEAWARALFPDGWHVASAGLVTYPITEKTSQAMAEVGLNMEGQRSKSVDEVDLDSFDRVVTLSGQSTRFLPRLKDPARHLARPMTDPMAAKGSDEAIRLAFATARDHIGTLVCEVIRELGGVPKSPPSSS